MKARTLTRRSLGLGALGAMTALATGAGTGSGRRFLFVQAGGGWDPLCVFAQKFDSPLIQMEPGAEPLSIGSFRLVDAAARPHVPEFFQRFGDRTLLLNGISTRSVNHRACAAIANTGTPAGDKPDWATLLGGAVANDLLIPHMGFDAVLFAGASAGIVASADGLLRPALDGSLLQISDAPVASPMQPAAGSVDRYLASRLTERASEGGLYGTYGAAHQRAHALVEASDAIRIEPASSFLERIDNAVRLLAGGVIRCATVGTAAVREQVWDTHTDNGRQTVLFDDLFRDLIAVQDLLAATQAADGTFLSDNTVMVVLSEMGRTPAFNELLGRDHWPFTSAMIVGPGVTGGRTIGAYDHKYIGVGVDPATGDLDPERAGISSETLGATLLALGDVDSEQYLPGVEPIAGVLA